MKKEYDLKKLKKKPAKSIPKEDVNKTLLSVRLNTNDLIDIKTEAERLGIPYQTLIGSILHRFINGELIDRKSAEFLKLISEVS
ncbi:hypothetical protein [Bdellovibrio sp. KM01]|uniref:hypothetical protein n=1 Tax=Bdellovibrio sp. KM01 TaxID=2748865 RepID=UPI0015EAF1B8|nr:hypothetical protein [Bdellovibrio sp. KM01]QLY24230.1 hypothetical protein HW988_12235 [Bdellovibrio sp. KM01]